MSTRYYRLWQKGGPQRRVFLPNFWLKLVKPTHEQLPNVVQFACSMQMTVHDIKNYLEKIYKIDVVQVNTKIALGKTRQDPGKGYVVKADDIKYAYVTLPRDQKFEFPNLYPDKVETEKKDEEKRSIEAARQQHIDFVEKTKNIPGLPGWLLK